MAQRVNIVLVDDLDGTDADETVTFGLDGSTTRSTCPPRTQPSCAMPWRPMSATAAHRWAASAGGTGRASGKSEPRPRDPRVGRNNGYDVSDRGRVSAEVRDAYAAAH